MFKSSTELVDTNMGLASSTSFSGARGVADPVTGVRAGILISIGASRSSSRSRLDLGGSGLAAAGLEGLVPLSLEGLGLTSSSSSLESESLVSAGSRIRTGAGVGLGTETIFFETGFFALGLISVSESELELELEDSESDVPELPETIFFPFCLWEESES